MLRYFSKMIFRFVPCPFPMSPFRSISEFAPYTLRHNPDVQIPLFKKSLAFNFFLRKACSLWNSPSLETNLLQATLMSRIVWNPFTFATLQIIVSSTFQELILVWHPYVVCFASPTVHRTPIKISCRICVCGEIETEINLFFYCNFHDSARAVLFNRVCNIVTDNKSKTIIKWGRIRDTCGPTVWVRLSCCVYSYLVGLMNRWRAITYLGGCFAL